MEYDKSETLTLARKKGTKLWAAKKSMMPTNTKSNP